jgi:hypothetical protein
VEGVASNGHPYSDPRVDYSCALKQLPCLPSGLIERVRLARGREGGHAPALESEDPQAVRLMHGAGVFFLAGFDAKGKAILSRRQRTGGVVCERTRRAIGFIEINYNLA